jgi:hypothetical protein
VFAIAKISKKFGFGKDFFLFFAIFVAVVAVLQLKSQRWGRQTARETHLSAKSLYTA